MHTKSFSIAFCLLFTATSGCNQTTSVEGTVTLNGKLVETGAISFRPTGRSGKSFGGMITNGKYTVQKAQPGERMVVINAIDQEWAITSREDVARLMEKAKAEGKSAADVTSVDLIPPNAEGNGQVVEVVAGAQTFDFKIKTE